MSGGNPISRNDPLGLKNYSECETIGLLTDAAKRLLRDGPAFSLVDIAWLRTHDYDYSFNSQWNDTFTFNGNKMNASDFGNFRAGFQGATHDSAFGLNVGLAQRAVEGAGILFHLVGLTDAINDPWDKTGMPFIKQGENAARSAPPNVCSSGRK